MQCGESYLRTQTPGPTVKLAGPHHLHGRNDGEKKKQLLLYGTCAEGVRMETTNAEARIVHSSRCERATWTPQNSPFSGEMGRGAGLVSQQSQTGVGNTLNKQKAIRENCKKNVQQCCTLWFYLVFAPRSLNISPVTAWMIKDDAAVMH